MAAALRFLCWRWVKGSPLPHRFLLVWWCVWWFSSWKGQAMAFISEMYPPRWRELRRIKLAQVGLLL